MEKKTITVDGISYDLEQFSEGVQQATNIYNAVQTDLNKHQLEVIKCQAALQNIGAQITDAVKKELEAKKAAATEGETKAEAKAE